MDWHFPRKRKAWSPPIDA